MNVWQIFLIFSTDKHEISIDGSVSDFCLTPLTQIHIVLHKWNLHNFRKTSVGIRLLTAVTWAQMLVYIMSDISSSFIIIRRSFQKSLPRGKSSDSLNIMIYGCSTYVHDMVHMIWSIYYGLYDMVHMIWSIYYGLYYMVHMIWEFKKLPFQVWAFDRLVGA